MTLIDVWQKAQKPIRTTIGETSYDTWFSHLKICENNPGVLTIQAPDEYFKNWIDERYRTIIERCLRTEAGQGVNIEFAVNAELLNKNTQQKLTLIEKSFAPADKNLNLNPRFLFENFVVGAGNRFAFAAAQAVAENPAKAYNPFFIYGPVGLGKTHLLQAISHEAQRKNPNLKICYLSSEQFTNELINSIRHHSAESFRQKYRHVDILLIDDIHFIAGKMSTQEEFFHTFNTLHDHHKQIIICSDRPPKEISNLEERLVSRFAWGLVTDIQPPDYETRVAILRKKLELESVTVPDDVLLFIAQEIKTNIRELEGALIRVVAYSLLEDKMISLNLAKQVLKDMVKETIKTISVDMVQKEVAVYYNVPLVDLKNKKRNKNVVVPRQVAMYLTRKLTTHSLPEIGAAFGGKDHTTVLHAYKKIEKDLINNSDIKKAVDYLNSILLQ
ncbi:MAG: chromosomal replication initiator protein DnaA [Candidatus Omnitrophica bacterium]|nr:chromosomal replication initiator protein DnaA [Candidatus Omnitrophota bacterium]